MKNLLKYLLIIIITLTSLNCNGIKPVDKAQVTAQYEKQNLKQFLTVNDKMVIFIGTDSDLMHSSTIYGESNVVTININLDKINVPIGSQIKITPSFISGDTSVPDNLEWFFSNNQKEIIILKDNNQKIYHDKIMMKVAPSNKYYYHNFLLKMKILANQQLLDSTAQINVYFFNIMNTTSIGKLYLGNYDINKQQYQMPILSNIVNINDDGTLVLNKIINTSFDNKKREVARQNTDSQNIVTIWDRLHHEHIMPKIPVDNFCKISNDKISTIVLGISNEPIDFNTQNVTWDSIPHSIGFNICKADLIKRTYTNVYGHYISDRTIQSFQGISPNGLSIAYNNQSVINNQDKIWNLQNADNVDFAQGNFVEKIADSSVILAYDTREQPIPHKDWLVCANWLKCAVIFHNDTPIIPHSVNISGDGNWIYGIATQSSKTSLFLMERQTRKLLEENIMISQFNIADIKPINMYVTNQKLLKIQFDSTDNHRYTKLYSSNTHKWLDSTTLIQYLGLSDYLVNGQFMGIIDISPNGQSIAIYFTNNELFTENNLNTVAIYTYNFRNSSAGKYQSIDQLVDDIGQHI